MNVPAFRPPVAPGSAGAPADYEVISRPVDLFQAFTAGQAGLGPTRVGATVRRWTGCDVYVSIGKPFASNGIAPFPLADMSIGVLVFAVSAGARTLVATGRVSSVDVGTSKLAVSVHDVICESFEVNVTVATPDPVKEFVAAGTLAGVTIVASDAAATERADAGVVPLGGSNGVLLADAATIVTPPGDRFQVIGVIAVAATAGRWLHLHNASIVGAALNTRTPTFSFAIPTDAVATSTGPTVCVDTPGVLWSPRFNLGLAAVVSSTPLVTTSAAANDAAYQVFYR